MKLAALLLSLTLLAACGPPKHCVHQSPGIVYVPVLIGFIDLGKGNLMPNYMYLPETQMVCDKWELDAK